MIICCKKCILGDDQKSRTIISDSPFQTPTEMPWRNMVKTCGPEFHLLPNLDKVLISFDKLYNNDLFPSIHGVFIQNIGTINTVSLSRNNKKCAL